MKRFFPDGFKRVSSIRLYIHKLWLILKISISSKLFRVASCMLKDAVLLYNLDFIIIILPFTRKYPNAAEPNQ